MKKIENIPFAPSPAIILVRPQLAENMGMVARAMMNCCLSELRIVAPRDNPLSEKAISASSGAQSILEEAYIYDSLEEAVKDQHFILATTARKRDMTKPIFAPEKAIQLLFENIAHSQKTGILFGAERTGLENDELIFANGIIEIPLNPLHCSLNLSQAVLLIGYEWFKAIHFKENTRFETGTSPLADKSEIASFLTHLETELDKRGYFRFTEKKERMSHNLRNIFTRNNLTHSEIKTLHGIVTDLIRPITKHSGK